MVSFWFSLSVPSSATSAAPPRILNAPVEIRGVWITNVASGVLFSPWGIPRAINQLADLQFNTVYPVVWNRGKAFYHSDALEKVTGRAIAPLLNWMHLGQDPLQEMVALSHQQNIRILPWFEYGFMVPLKSAIAQQHPDWLTTRQNGSRSLTDNSKPEALPADTFNPEAEAPSKGPKKGWLARLLNSGAPEQIVWLNPLHPAVQTLLLDMVEEVVTLYPVDGVQFDDHFSLPVEFGYDPYTVALYQAEHSGQSPPDNPADEDWIRWRADKLSRFVEILHASVKAKCPTCQLSLSPNPAKFAYRFYLQDWRLWVKKGWIDDLVVQIYRDDIAQFDGELGKQALQEASDRIPVSIGILTGTWQRPISFEQIRQQVEHSRDRQFAGISFFYWDTLWSYFTPESPEQRRQNFRALLQNTLLPTAS
ncbi:MAG: hypothetical protein DCF25_00035 [Leptolyngbya foveolarum]|uniref:Glycosyl hydrolase-like 10 domain-containing protein n=1 Tax=Leptolyngbya foveolarum TaxID=47253 RepID=A0A2W4UTH1_9CYAN|nr:MAG: hypothetical protein DCF25_00035 [Leptolyngbya foveolarum]